MIHVERIVNQLMTSNCYVLVDEAVKHCVCIDPASEKSERERIYIDQNNLTLDYILLTHEHIDHTWGVNALIDNYPSAKVICSKICKETLPNEAQTCFQYYYDKFNYSYQVKRVDYTTEELNWRLEWSGRILVFVSTPGHSPGSVCISMDNMLFGGDTLMLYKPFVNKRKGGSKEQLAESITKMQNCFEPNTIVYPGHGESFHLREMKDFYDRYFKEQINK